MSDISSETINQMLADIRATMPATRESDAPTDPSELPPSATEPEDEPDLAPDQSPELPAESTPESEPTPTVPASEPPAPADASAHQAPQPSSSPSSPSLPARTLSDEDWDRYQAYQQLDQRLRTDPQFAEQFRQAIATQPASQPVSEPASESYISQDPAYQTLQQQLQQLNSVLSRHEAIISQQAEIENAATMTRAKEAFKSAHNLDATQMQRVYDEAQSLAPAMQTYAAQGIDQQTALGKIFESAYWQIPEFRDKEMASYLETSRADQKRKAKAGSLSGSSGSVPRSTNRPLNEQEKRSAMIKEIADSIGQPTE